MGVYITIHKKWSGATSVSTFSKYELKKQSIWISKYMINELIYIYKQVTNHCYLPVLHVSPLQ